MKRNRKFRTTMKLTLLLILSVLLLSLVSCADIGTKAHTEAELPSATTPAVTDDPHALIAHLLHPCEIPDGYVYPEGTAQYYIDNGLWLKEDFYRPDIIWGGSTLVTMDIPRPGTVRYSINNNPLSYPDTKYAFTVGLYQDMTPETEIALATYLSGLGFELMDTRNSLNRLIFAGTGRAIKALDCPPCKTPSDAPQRTESISNSSIRSVMLIRKLLPKENSGLAVIHPA